MAPIAPIPPSMAPAQPALGGVGSLTAGMLQMAQGAQGLAAAGQAAPLASFQEFFADAVKKTNELQNAAEGKQRQLLVGETDNLHDVMIAMEKADLSFQLTLAVRNKVIEAYQEVMRMQI